MPDRVEFFDLTCAASVPANAPTEVVLQCAPGIPRKFTIIIPDGHAGLTGIALGYGHQPVIPRTAQAYISSNDEYVQLDLHGYPAGPTWSAFLCNNDLQPHVWGLMFELDEIPAAQMASVDTALTPSAITTAGEQMMVGV